MVDTNLIVYLLVPSEYTQQAEKIFAMDSQWIAPLLWRSEFRSALTLYLRQGLLSLSEGLQTMEDAEELMEGREYQVSSSQVIRLVADSRCSAYDCEFVALAHSLAVPLVTFDRRVLLAFPSAAIAADSFGS